MKLKRPSHTPAAGLAGLDLRVALAAIAASAALAPFAEGRGEFRRLPAAEYRDRMAAGWIGQMLAVGLGWPTEFKFQGRIIPPEKVPRWEPGMVNMFKQDDLYVEMTFLRTLELHGFDVSSRQAGIDFANSGQ